jgi:radical SAM protein with 4Fe4S-binding SPASM domain
MLREDFEAIFDYITRNTAFYSINTNGTLITPRIAELMRRKGNKWVALYGADAMIHDIITRTPGSFEAMMEGVARLKEAGAGFVVQIIPMQDNIHQYQAMVDLALSLSPFWRVGATWLYLSSSRNQVKNEEIKAQRLDPKQALEIDASPFPCEIAENREGCPDQIYAEDDRLFAACISKREDFHIDPYGTMSFCGMIVDPELRYDVRMGSVKQGWEKFIPSLADKIRGGEEYRKNCGTCDFRENCGWCPVFGYLERRRYSARVPYLCRMARENKKIQEQWLKNHRRYFQIAGVTIQVESEIPLTDKTFQPRFEPFRVDSPGDDVIKISHSFHIPDLKNRNLGKEVYGKIPWIIYRKGRSWIYLSVSTHGEEEKESVNQVAVFNETHTRARIFTDGDAIFRKGNLNSLIFLSTDQIFLARILAHRKGCILHASGVILHGKGLLFLGHSEAGKSTMVKFLKDRAEILCDDRMIIRRWSEGFKIHGTWSHGEVPLVSENSAPLKAIFFLNKAKKNQLTLVDKHRQAFAKILSCLIKPLKTGDWWEKMLDLVDELVREIPCYTLDFDKSGRIVELIKKIEF